MPDSAVTFDVQRLAGYVPPYLRERAHWVCWEYAQRKGRRTKCPISPTRGGRASSVDSKSWGTFEQAITVCQAARLGGVGFVFSADDPFAGVDLDNCIDPATGQPKPWAQAILDRLDSYSEISPSGAGVKIFVRASKPGPRCKTGYEDGAIEMYDRDRFFTLTGQSLHDPPKAVEERQVAVDALYTQVFGPPETAPASISTPSPKNDPVRLADDEIIRLACASKKSGPKFASLWAGRWNEFFNSRSEADASVVFTLAFFTKDAGQIDRIFRRSALLREKWDELHGPQTYGALTIAKALATVSGQYQPRRSSKNRAAKPSTTATALPAPSERPQIQGNERQLRDIRRDALAALYAANRPPRLFHRAGGIARIDFVQQAHDGAVPRVQQFDPDALRGELTNVADWFTLKHGKQGDYIAPDLPPLAIARDLLAQPALDLPPLHGVITCPTFAADGSLIFENGYHPASGLWHHRTLTDLPPIPEAPSRAVIAEARTLLLDILADFPFVDDAGRANAMALLLLPFVRPLIAGPTPLHAVDAPSPATGKDLLVKAALLPALGREIGATTTAKDPDEWRKKITAALVSDCPAILWGNVAHRLDSEHLAAVLTDTLWRDRQLGHTRELLLPNRAVWTATGNNLAFSRELTRRVVWIRLDARMETPEQRSNFRHPDLLRHVRDHRAALVHAALILVRAWLAAGRPGGRQTMGSFENYVRIMGGILEVAGISGFLANADELRTRADGESTEWRAFVQAWWEQWKESWVGVSDLAKLLWTEDGRRSDLLLGIITSERERGAVTQLGKRLSAKRECVIGGLRITVSTQLDKSGRLQYRVTPVEPLTSRQTSADFKSEVCHEVCHDKSGNINELQHDGRHGILFPVSPHMCVGAHAHAHAHAQEAGSPKKSAMSADAAQPAELPTVSSADFKADFRQTSNEPALKSASRPAANHSAAWFTGNGDPISRSMLELVQPREGWTPRDWHNRLRQLAQLCEDLNPERAAELRQAAALMSKPPGERA